jgi:hypothetical protein
LAAGLSLGTACHNVFSGCDASTYFDPCDCRGLVLTRGVFHHDDGIRARWDWRSCHDGGGLTAFHLRRNFARLGTRFDLSNDVERGWELCQICGAHCVSVAGGAGKRRNVAIRGYGLRKHAPGGGEQV